MENILWLMLLIVSFLSLLTVLWTYIKGGDKERNPSWKEMIIIPFYFTTQSNFLAFILSLLVVFKKIKNKEKIKTLSIFMAVNLLITFIVYWSVLFPKAIKIDWHEIISNLTLHGLTPILSILVFIFRYVINKKVGKNKINIFKRSMFYLFYPIIWLIISIILYFILGGQSKDAIYGFLIITRPINFVIYVSVISIIYYLSTLLFAFLSNPKKSYHVLSYNDRL